MSGKRPERRRAPVAMNHLWREIVHYIDCLGPREWFLIMAAMIGVAVVCMRGFGSRSQY
jgi:hypothetical protein